MKKYIKIKNMTCNSCKVKIENKVSSINYVNSAVVHLNKNILEIDYNDELDINIVCDKINKLGYETNINMVVSKINNYNTTIINLVIITLVLSIYLILRFYLGIDFNTIMPEINSSTSLIMLFVIGLLSSIHCISMCGGIMLSVCSKSDKPLKKPLLYNGGRLFSYTVVGAVCGFIGSSLSLNNTVYFIFMFIAALMMFVASLSMLNIVTIKISSYLPKFKNKGNTPFVVGILSGLMPCGALISMQLYAVSTNNFLLGALSMFLFCLGTIPIMMISAFIFNKFNSKSLKIVNIISAFLILILSLMMFERAFTYVGVDVDVVDTSNYIESTQYDDYQEVTVNVSFKGYADIIVKKGIPVRLNLYVRDDTIVLSNCNREVKFDEWNTSIYLNVGDNYVYFTPKETGDFIYTCWMNMIVNKIKVVE